MKKRFPDDFMFRLTEKELSIWKSQNVTSDKEKIGLRKLPLAFSEQGVAMLSSVLNSRNAIDVNIQIIRIFTRLREVFLTHKDVLLKLEKLEKKIFKQNDHLRKQEEEIQMVFNVLKKLLSPPQQPRKRIGFKN